jgi:hypothetical protein
MPAADSVTAPVPVRNLRRDGNASSCVLDIVVSLVVKAVRVPWRIYAAETALDAPMRSVRIAT